MMKPSEENFVDYWSTARKKWNWKEKFMTAVQYFAIPFTILIHLTNFFIIGDLAYHFISFKHLLEFVINLFIISLISGFGFGFYHWNSHEMRYWRIMKREQSKE